MGLSDWQARKAPIENEGENCDFGGGDPASIQYPLSLSERKWNRTIHVNESIQKKSDRWLRKIKAIHKRRIHSKNQHNSKRTRKLGGLIQKNPSKFHRNREISQENFKKLNENRMRNDICHMHQSMIGQPEGDCNGRVENVYFSECKSNLKSDWPLADAFARWMVHRPISFDGVDGCFSWTRGRSRWSKMSRFPCYFRAIQSSSITPTASCPYFQKLCASLECHHDVGFGRFTDIDFASATRVHSEWSCTNY